MREKKVAVIDLDSVAFSAGSGNKVLDEYNQPIRENGRFVYEDKTEEQIAESVDYFMKLILNNVNADSYIAYIKGKGNFRYSINPEYKANRPKDSPKWWAYTKKCFIENWKAVEVNGIEVDDAVNITRLQIPNSIICAIDKDLLSLEGQHYNWRKDTIDIVDTAEANRLFWLDMIIGQPGDNIKGLPGKGEKYAEKVFNTELIECGVIDLSSVILSEYIKHFGESKGINEFYRNYKSLKILESYEGFVIPEIVEFKKPMEELF